MPQVPALNQNQIQEALRGLSNWSVKDGKLYAEFHFETFVEAFAFMTRVAFAAEAAQHHPEWRNVYNRVEIQLVTHDAGNSISHKDTELARQIERIAGAQTNTPSL